MSTKPRTAGQARIQIRQIIRDLPEDERGRLGYWGRIANRTCTAEDVIAFLNEMGAEMPESERERLSCFAVAIRQGHEESDEPFFFAEMLRFIMSWPEGLRLMLLVMAIEAMRPAERRRWTRYCERPGVLGTSGLRDILLKALHSADSGPGDAQKEQAFQNAFHPLSPAALARIELVGTRVEAIDALLEEGYLRSQVYEQMRTKHEELIPGRGQKFMEEDSMWESYTAAGGCHENAIRPRGRPRKK